MVGGKWLYRDGAYPTLDKEKIMKKTREARNEIVSYA
jgi:hypothetical protein